jgi:Type I restriction enzyme R protein N terminus (HSDR_N)
VPPCQGGCREFESLLPLQLEVNKNLSSSFEVGFFNLVLFRVESGMYSDFDFEILKDPNFKEDSVREELIAPLLKALGYSSSGDAKIIRSKALDHPFVYIGTKSNHVKIIPDYLLKIREDHCWVLDAKAPSENIQNGKNVEQAYSYAIHPEVRASIYALCNGYELTAFHISKIKPILTIKLDKIDSQINAIQKLLSPQTFNNFKASDYNPDYGLHILKLGFSENILIPAILA